MAGNKIEYNGELYDSGWEVTLVKWLVENNIEYIRPTYSIPWIDSKGKNRKYFPDFYIPKNDLYLDPKNKLCVKKQKEKLDYVTTKINLVYGEVSTIIKTIKES